MENVDFSELMTTALFALGGIVALGTLISRYTKTPKDDAFFARVGAALNFFKKPGA